MIGCGDFVSGTIVQSEIQASVRPDYYFAGSEGC